MRQAGTDTAAGGDVESAAEDAERSDETDAPQIAREDVEVTIFSKNAADTRVRGRK